jgi:LysM repeat protein
MFKRIGLLILFISSYVQVSAAVQDSIGVEKKNGITYVQHKLEQGETLYGISKRYKTPVDSILSSNPGLQVANLKPGMVLLVPISYGKPAPVNTSSSVHIVETGETLYSISKKYGISVEELKALNPGMGTSLAVGQPLNIPKKGVDNQTKTLAPNTQTSTSGATHTVVAGETLYSISRKYGVTVDALTKANPSAANGLNVGTVLVIPGVNPVVTKPLEQTTVTKSTTQEMQNKEVITEPDKNSAAVQKLEKPRPLPPSASGKVIENGMAVMIPNDGGTTKFLALHANAEEGTIIQVTNEANGQKVFVRVIGTFPVDAANDKVVLKLSKAAWDRLGGVDKKMVISLSFIR